MGIIVNTRNEAEEHVVTAFLNSLKITYRSTADFEDDDALQGEYLSLYNEEINNAVAGINSGNFVSHEDVEKLFSIRRNTLYKR
jgi:hypothetical protein